MKKKIVILILCEIIISWLPLMLSKWYHGLQIGIALNLLSLIYFGLVIIGFGNVIFSLISLIIFEKSDKKVAIKHWFAYSLAGTIGAILALIFLSAEAGLGLDVYAPGF